MRLRVQNIHAAMKVTVISAELLCAAGLVLLLLFVFVIAPIFQHGWKGTTPLILVVFVGTSLYGFYRIVGPGNLARFYEEVKAVITKVVSMVQLAISLAFFSAFFLVPAVWLSMVLDSPQSSPAPGELDQAAVATFRVKGLLFRRMPDNADFRLEQHKGFNVDIWVYQRDLETIPYPDRKPFIESIGTTWCDAPGIRDQHTLLPSVAVRDMKSGKELASYSCVLSRAELK